MQVKILFVVYTFSIFKVYSILFVLEKFGAMNFFFQFFLSVIINIIYFLKLNTK